MNIAEVKARGHEALEPQAGLLKVDLRDAPRDLVVGRMANCKHFVGLAGNSALVSLQDTIVRGQLGHLMQMRLLDGADVVPKSSRTEGNFLSPPPALQLMKSKRPAAS